MKKIVSAVLALLLLCSLSVVTYADSSAFQGVQLELIGTIADEEMELNLRYGLPLLVGEDDSAVILPLDGEEESGVTIMGADALSGQVIIGSEFTANNGYAVITTDSEDVNNTGLATGYGRILLECETCLVNTITGSDRYVIVGYATEEVSSEDDYYIWSTDRDFAIFPDPEEDTFYDGYGLIYDLSNECFVGDIDVTNCEVTGLGDNFGVYNGEETIVYDCEGEEVFSVDGRLEYGRDFAIYSENGTDYVVDTEGEDLFEEEDLYLDVVNGDGAYVRSYESEYDEKNDEYIYSYFLLDKDGNKVLPDVYEAINRSACDTFRVEKDGEEWIVNAEGETVAPAIDGEEYSYASIGYGYWYAHLDDLWCYYGPDGLILESENSAGNNLVFSSEEDEDLYYVIEEGDFTLELKQGADLAFGLVAGKEKSTGGFGLYDVYSGEKLLDNDYEDIAHCNGYIYAYKDGAWEVYSVEMVAEYELAEAEEVGKD